MWMFIPQLLVTQLVQCAVQPSCFLNRKLSFEIGRSFAFSHELIQPKWHSKICVIWSTQFHYLSETNLCNCTAHGHGPVCEQRAGILVDISVTWSCSSSQTTEHLLQAEKDLSSALGLHQQNNFENRTIQIHFTSVSENTSLLVINFCSYFPV